MVGARSGIRNRSRFSRIQVLFIMSVLTATGICAQMINLQVAQGGAYSTLAEQNHLGYSEVTARRGEILIRDPHSDELFRLATNISQPTLFADPSLIKDAAYVTDKLAPLIFDKEAELKKEGERIRQTKRIIASDVSPEEQARVLGSLLGGVSASAGQASTNTAALELMAATSGSSTNTTATAVVIPPPPPTAEHLKVDAVLSLKPRNEEELFAAFKADLLQRLGQKTRSSILLYKDPGDGIKDFLSKNKISGIELTSDGVMAYPQQISDQDYTAKVLAPVVEIPFERLKELLYGRNRYAVLRTKLPTEIEQKIRDMIKEDKSSKKGLFTGINFQEKTYRYYPEGELAAQAVGFTSERGGVYGIEQSFDLTLRGKKGIFKTRLDATGQQVIVGDDLIIEPAIDGDSIVLTIDRSIQMMVERYLAKAVKDTKADSGLVIIMEPKTGRIVSMAHYPTFDPNKFSEALETEDIALSAGDIGSIKTLTNDKGEESYFLESSDNSHVRIQIFKTVLQTGKIIYSKYKNTIGPAAFKNRSVTDIWEPGSIFKAIAMSIALDDGDVTPTTTFNDSGPLMVDEFPIRNALDKYYGITNMRQVLERSLNTGMAFVARKMGRELFGKYIKKFGFGEKTDLEFENEHPGQIADYNRWAESELITHAFGQGLAVTPIQMITAFASLANKGVLMKPHIVDSIIQQDGKVVKVEPEEVRRVVSEKTADTISAMLVSVVENGGAVRVLTPGYHIAGKTGTAQTYKNGKPLFGPGTTIGSFVGFAPVEDPKFIMLVQIDRPRSTVWADASAAPLFKDVSDFLFKYYNIPPGKL